MTYTDTTADDIDLEACIEETFKLIIAPRAFPAPIYPGTDMERAVMCLGVWMNPEMAAYYEELFRRCE